VTDLLFILVLPIIIDTTAQFMNQSHGHISQAVKSALSSGKEIVVVAYSLIDTTERIINDILDHVFSRIGREDLIYPVFSSIKELTTNAIKANIKKILIDEGVIKNPDDLYEVVRVIKSVLNEKDLLAYGLKCEKAGLSIRIHFNISKTELSIRIIDPFPLTQEQEHRINEKIRKAYGYDDLAICYLENPDPFAEGMGLGLAMVVVLLKGSGINPDAFRITSDSVQKKTIASIVIPLDMIRNS